MRRKERHIGVILIIILVLLLLYPIVRNNIKNRNKSHEDIIKNNKIINSLKI